MRRREMFRPWSEVARARLFPAILAALVCGSSAAARAPLTGPGSREQDLPLAVILDVGSESDTDPASGAYLQEGPGLSPRQTADGITYRTLNAGNRLLVCLRPPAGLTLDRHGVPNTPALLTVRYRDVVDETNCYRWSSSRAYCRPRIDHRLDYGYAPQPHWHGLGAFAGLADGAWKETSAFLDASPWQTLRALDGWFQFQVTYPSQLAAAQPLPIDRLELRFVSGEEFNRLREADRADRTLSRSDYVESRTWQRADTDPAFMLYARNRLERIFPNSVPDRSEIVTSLEAIEVAGEAEPVSFAIYALRDLQAVQVAVSALRGPGGTIGQEHVHVGRVLAVDKRWAYSTDRYYGVNPWVIDDFRPEDQPAGESRQAWITVRVPADTLPGTYAGRITVTAANAPASELELRLEVVALDLEPPEAMPYLYHSPYLLGKYFATDRRIALRDMADHDVYPIIYLDAAIDLNTFDVDLRDIDEELRDLQALGILPPEPRVGITDNAYTLYRRLCPGVPEFGAPCPEFDEVYRGALRAYRAAFAPYGVTPVFSFRDEPGADPERRRPSNYMNRLTQEIGLRTWVTYYPECERPLAGHSFSLDELSAEVARVSPAVVDDSHLAGYWDFESDTVDRSPYRHAGVLQGGATITDGALYLPDQQAALRVPHAPSLTLTDTLTIGFWFKPEACPTGYASHPVAKWSSTNDANYVFYFFGSYDGRYPENAGRLQWYANAAGTWGAVSGATVLDCQAGLGRWYHLLWVHDASQKGVLYVNGLPAETIARGSLTANDQGLRIGGFRGWIDELFLLRRALGPDEIVALAQAINGAYDQQQTAQLTLQAQAPFSETLTLALADELPLPAALESQKSVWVNGQLAWSADALPHTYSLIPIHLPRLPEGAPLKLEFRVVNGHTRREQLQVDFVEDAWRNADWSYSSSADSRWHYAFSPDPAGTLGPMDPYLDDRVYAMRYVSAAERARTLAVGDSFSYYTTYPATQPVPLNNRFLNGIYGSAVGATGIYVYAYGDSGPQPWDDCEAGIYERLGTDSGRRSQNNYQLALPSWEDRMFDTVAFESLREGIEDSRLIATLKQAIREHPGPLADEATRYLAAILARPSPEYWPRYMRYDATQPIQWYADRSRDMLIDLAGDPDDYAFFDRFRAQLMRYILRLQHSSTPGPLCLPLTLVRAPGMQ